jgi:hypothetical protein
VASSMAWREQSCQVACGDARDRLAGFRRDVYRCLWRRADALFETMEAVLTAGRVPSLPYLSLEPVMRRGHGMVYQGLAQGRVDEDALRDLLVRSRPPDWPCVFGVDAYDRAAVGGDQPGPGVPSPQLRRSHRFRGSGDQGLGLAVAVPAEL